MSQGYKSARHVFYQESFGLIAELVSSLRKNNEQLEQQVTYLQAVSTAQVERIRALEAQVAEANRILEKT